MQFISYTLRVIKMVGHPGYAPGVSPSQAARISIFLVPEYKCRFKNGGLCGHCSRDLPLDRRLLFVAELTGLYIERGSEMVRRLGNAPSRPVRAPVLQADSHL